MKRLKILIFFLILWGGYTNAQTLAERTFDLKTLAYGFGQVDKSYYIFMEESGNHYIYSNFENSDEIVLTIEFIDSSFRQFYISKYDYKYLTNHDRFIKIRKWNRYYYNFL